MSIPTKDQLKRWLTDPAPLADLRAQVRQSPTTPILLDTIREEITDGAIPTLTYTLYRVFEHSGARGPYEIPYFLKRAQLTRAVLELFMGDESKRDVVHDLVWSLCEETSWVLPAHEEQGPRYWEITPAYRSEVLGAHTMLTREPDSIDLFAAETGAALAETVYLVGDSLAPEVRQRVRQEVERRIFKPYLAHGRDHWWFKGDLNWNGVCNGSIGLAFLRLEKDAETLAEALVNVLEGFAAYIATGFEADGGSIEGVGYWNYGLMYFITVAELLREITHGELDLLAQPRLRDIAAYPPGMALAAPNLFINFGDSTETQTLSAGVVNRLAERTGIDDLRALLVPLGGAHESEAGHITGAAAKRFGYNFYSKLPIIFRTAAWWDCTQPAQALEPRDFVLPDTGLIKFAGQTSAGKTVLLVAKAGHNGGHHSHTDVGQFIVNVDGESLIPDPGRGLYSKEYFREGRYQNVFNNSYSHSVPRIGGQLQAAGPEFGDKKLLTTEDTESTEGLEGKREKNKGSRFYGTIIEHGQRGDTKFAVIDFHQAYNLPDLKRARRTLELNNQTGAVTLADAFEFATPLPVEEAFSTWSQVEVKGNMARIIGERSALELTIVEPAGAVFAAESLEEACRANLLDGVLTRLTVALPEDGAARFVMHITPA